MYVCRRNERSRGLAGTSRRARLPPRRRESSSARRWSTFAKVSTAPDRRSRPLPLDCRRRDARGWISRRPRRARFRRRLERAKRARMHADTELRHEPQAPQNAHAQRLARCRGRAEARPLLVHWRRRHVLPPPNGRRVSDLRPRGRRRVRRDLLPARPQLNEPPALGRSGPGLTPEATVHPSGVKR